MSPKKAKVIHTVNPPTNFSDRLVEFHIKGTHVAAAQYHTVPQSELPNPSIHFPELLTL